MNETNKTIKLEKTLVKEEAELFYSQPDELKELGCIGHLRGDFGREGDEFYTSWFPHQCEEKNDARFSCVLTAVVDTLRKQGGVLCNRKDMYTFCSPKHENKLDNSHTSNCWGFRIVAQGFAFYLRCMTDRGDYNFYLYCYDHSALISYLSQRRGLPPYCYSYQETSNEVLCIVFGGVGGCLPFQADNAKEEAEKRNNELGVSKAQAEAMRYGCLIGWNKRGANPNNYNEDGTPKIRS